MLATVLQKKARVLIAIIILIAGISLVQCSSPGISDQNRGNSATQEEKAPVKYDPAQKPDKNASVDEVVDEEAARVKAEEDAKKAAEAEAKKAEEDAKKAAEQAEKDRIASETVSQKNATKMAKDYLKYMPFSKQGLIKQLEYEGFSPADAAYGAEYSGANWMVQAEKMAKDYLKYMPFSKQGLIKQLEYEGFTSDEIQFGIDRCGANWMEQAEKMAKSYVDHMAFSRQGLISQLLYEGFSNEEAEHGVNSVGL